MDVKNFWETALKTANKEITPLDFIVLMAVETLADNEVGYCYSSNIGIAKRLGRHESTVSKCISRLIKTELIYKREIRKGTMIEERRLYPISGYKLWLEDGSRELVKTLQVTLDNGEKLIINERSTKMAEDRARAEKKNNVDKLEKKKQKEEIEKLFEKYGFTANKGTITNVIKSGAEDKKIEEVLSWAKTNKQGIGSIIKALNGEYGKLKEKEVKKEVRPLAGAYKKQDAADTEADDYVVQISEVDRLKHSIWLDESLSTDERLKVMNITANIETLEDVQNKIDEFKSLRGGGKNKKVS